MANNYTTYQGACTSVLVDLIQKAMSMTKESLGQMTAKHLHQILVALDGTFSWMTV